MAALPKMIYDGTRVGAVMYNGQEVFNIVERSDNGSIKHIYHKHQGDRDHKGGCYTVEKQETVSVSHIWTLGEKIDAECGDHIGSEVEGEDNSTYSYWTYRITDQHGHTAKVGYVWHSSSGRELCGQWVMKGMTDYANNAQYGQIEGYNAGCPKHGTDNTGPWNGAKTYTTTKSTKKTYYDLSCGFDQN